MAPRPRLDPPAAFSSAWPDEPCDDVAAEKIRLLVLALREVEAGSVRSVADRAGIDFSAVAKLMRGGAWPSSRTVALLEAGLGVALWPVEGAGDA